MSNTGNRVGPIVKKHFREAIRSRLVWALLGVLLLYQGIGILNASEMFFRSPERATRYLATSFTSIVPPLALVLGYNAIVGERESGSLRILLSLPTTRRDVMAGAYLSRNGILSATLLVAMTGLIIAVLYKGVGIAVAEIAATLGLVVLYGFAWTGIAIGISAAASTRFRAVAGVFGLYTLFLLFWDTLVIPSLAMLLVGSSNTGDFEPIEVAQDPSWYVYLNRINPIKAYEGLRVSLASVVDGTLPAVPNVFGFLMLIAWATVPVLLGFRYFDRADLA